ncbi:hypothetical protein BSKO_00667 [Bryopsis sp. KO-2023]|nr:hypothetical protein BSKO_00667 [Bryopsis sp. KO-2023]
MAAFVLLLHTNGAQGRLLKFLPSLPGADPEFDINGPRAKSPAASIDGPSLTINGGVDDASGSIVIGPFGLRSKAPPPLSAEGIVGLFDEPKTQKIEEEFSRANVDDVGCKQLLKLEGKIYCVVSEVENAGVLELWVEEWEVVEGDATWD